MRIEVSVVELSKYVLESSACKCIHDHQYRAHVSIYHNKKTVPTYDLKQEEIQMVME